MNQKLINYLFDTRAVRVCPKDRPFWYTSGRIGPYYVNTHFLYGSEEKANLFLEDINRLMNDRLNCSGAFHKATKENYLKDPIYKGTIDLLVKYIRQHIKLSEVDYISGGERRDWFFSFLVADILDKPHITIFKDMTSVIYYKGKTNEQDNIEGASVLHIADLITTASSYERAWVPAIKRINGSMKWSAVVVDRLQGGSNILQRLGVESHALIFINTEIFEKANKKGYIDDSQLKLVLDYMKNPDEFMDNFLLSHPDFLVESLKEGGKIAERARLLIESMKK